MLVRSRDGGSVAGVMRIAASCVPAPDTSSRSSPRAQGLRPYPPTLLHEPNPYSSSIGHNMKAPLIVEA